MSLMDPADINAKFEMKEGRPAEVPTEWLKDLPDERVSFGPVNPENPIEITDEDVRALTRGVVHPKKIAAVVAFAHFGTMTAAAKSINVKVGTIKSWMVNDQNFSDAIGRAREVAADVAEDEAYRRAVQGYLEPVYQQGRQVGTIRKFSDQVLMFLLRGMKPDKYMERHQHDVIVDVADRLQKARERALGRGKDDNAGPLSPQTGEKRP